VTIALALYIGMTTDTSGLFVKGGPLPVWSAFADASTKVGAPCTCRDVGRLRTAHRSLGGHGRLIHYRTTGAAALRSEVTFRSHVGIERATSPADEGPGIHDGDLRRAGSLVGHRIGGLAPYSSVGLLRIARWACSV